MTTTTAAAAAAEPADDASVIRGGVRHLNKTWPASLMEF